MSSVGDLDWHNSPDRPDLPFKPDTGIYGLTALEKATCKSILAHIVSNAWHLWMVLEYNFQLGQKWISIFCEGPLRGSKDY